MTTIETYFFTWSELMAYGVKRSLSGFWDSSETPAAVHAAANEIILLAERIKAERAVAAMGRR